MFIKDQKEFKKTATALRRELKELYGKGCPSHAQCLELLAKALGSSSYAQLQATLPDVTQAEPGARSVANNPQASQESNQAAKSATPPYPLRNTRGQFDIQSDGAYLVLASGLDWRSLQGTVEDIYSSVAEVACVTRNPDGSLELEWGGATEVNWNAQETRKDEQGFRMWLTSDGEQVCEAQCVLMPHSLVGSEGDSEDELDLLNREALLDEYLRYIEEQGLRAPLCEELPQHRLKAPTLQRIRDTLGFQLHRGELLSLMSVLGV